VANPTPGSRPARVDHELLPFESHFVEVGSTRSSVSAPVFLQGVGHFLQGDAPDDVCAKIRGWWPPS
jgi:hypothetical protein